MPISGNKRSKFIAEKEIIIDSRWYVLKLVSVSEINNDYLCNVKTPAFFLIGKEYDKSTIKS